MMRTFNAQKFQMGRIPPGEDLLQSIHEILTNRSIQSGYVWVLGALRNASVGYFDQKTREYETISIDEPVEIILCHGNVSLKEGKPFAHLHLSVGKRNGEMFGGHLETGNEVFVAEVCIAEFDGEAHERLLQPDLDLALWDEMSL